MPWSVDQLQFQLLDDHTADPIATVEITTPAGLMMVMANVEIDGATVKLSGLHVQSPIGGGAVGAANLMALAHAFMEQFGYDALEIEGAVRTTGTRPGHRPRPIRFARRSRPATG